MRVLGVSCTPKAAFLSLAEGQQIVEAPVTRVDVAAQYEASVEMLATIDEIRRAYERLRPDRVVILKPELNRKASYDEMAPRVALETLFRIAAVQARIDIEILARPTLRSRLALPRSGKLATHAPAVVDSPVAKYWTQGRDIAALAALAGARA